MNSQGRTIYQKEYREKYGDFMREQIKEWFKQHPDYLKKWRTTHPKYFQEYRENNRQRLNIYWRKYRRLKRFQSCS